MIERFLGPSWRTTAAGYVIAVCGSAGIADEINQFLPERLRYGMHALCLLSVAFGLTSAKDANVSHVPTHVAAEPKHIKP